MHPSAAMPVYYINLESETQRKDRFLQANGSVAEFCRYDAVNGALCKEDELVANGLLAESPTKYSQRAIGNALSHRQLWQQCSESGTTITVAEDDALFNKHFSRKAADLLRELPIDWDIVRWGWNFDSIVEAEVLPGLKNGVMSFDAPSLQQTFDKLRAADYEVFPYRLIQAFGTTCYSISPKGAEQLLRACFPIMNERLFIAGLGRPILVSSLSSTLNKFYHLLDAYVCIPPMVWSEKDVSRAPPA